MSSNDRFPVRSSPMSPPSNVLTSNNEILRVKRMRRNSSSTATAAESASNENDDDDVTYYTRFDGLDWIQYLNERKKVHLSA